MRALPRITITVHDQREGARIPGRRWAWALPCIILLVFGAAWRVPTFHVANYLQFASGRLAYSDVLGFHGGAIASLHHLPYLQENIEYPVLTGFTVWVTGFAPGVEGYFAANAVVLCGCLSVCFVLLARLRSRLARYAIAPGLAMYGVLNWDALAILGLVATVYCTRRGRFGWAGMWLAMGASAKLFPAFVLPALLAGTLRQLEPGTTAADTGRRARVPSSTLRVLAGFTGVTLLLNAPVAVLNWRGWSYFLVFQSQRGINLDAIWAHVPGISAHRAGVLFDVLFAIGVLWITWTVWRCGQWEVGALLSLLVFLLFTRDYSPQYDLWILPFLALLACPFALWLIFVLADFTYYGATFLFYFIYTGGQIGVSVNRASDLVALAVWGREVALALLFIWGSTQLLGITLPFVWQAPVRRLRASDPAYPPLDAA